MNSGSDSPPKAPKKPVYPAHLAETRFSLLELYTKARPDNRKTCNACQDDDTVSFEERIKLYTPGQINQHRGGKFHSYQGRWRRWLEKQSGVKYNRDRKEFKEDPNYDKNDRSVWFECPFPSTNLVTCRTKYRAAVQLEKHIAQKHLKKVAKEHRPYLYTMYLKTKPTAKEKLSMTLSLITKGEKVSSGPHRNPLPGFFLPQQSFAVTVNRKTPNISDKVQALQIAKQMNLGSIQQSIAISRLEEEKGSYEWEEFDDGELEGELAGEWEWSSEDGGDQVQ